MKSLSFKSQWLLAMGLVAVLMLGLWAYYGRHTRRTPAGQRPLLSLTAENVGQLRDAFNGAEGHLRILAFLSPT